MPVTVASPTNLDEAQIAAYKKARRNHVKSTRQRPPHDSFDWTPFRAAEKKYKARFPPPDLSNVLDLALIDEEAIGELATGTWKGRPDAALVRPVLLKTATASGEVRPGRKRKAFSIARIPGANHVIVFFSWISHRNS